METLSIPIPWLLEFDQRMKNVAPLAMFNPEMV